MLAPMLPDRKLTIDEFFDLYAGEEDKYELVRGVPVMMAGASRAHNRVVRNLLRHIGNALDGTPCEVMPSDMGVETEEDTYRLPDVGIYCDPRDLGPADRDFNRLKYPKVLIEVLSPGTARGDRFEKFMEYSDLPSLLAVALIHPGKRRITMFERAAGDARWSDVSLLPGAPLVLRDPAISLTPEKIFEGL